MTGFNTKVTPEIENLTQMCVDHSSMDVSLYGKYDVKRGLRDINGKGVLAGLTQISNVQAVKVIDGKEVPCAGSLYYRGYNIKDLTAGFVNDNRFGFEETTYLLLFGKLPSAKELADFQALLAAQRSLPRNFVRDVIMKAPGRDIMNALSRSVLTLYSYDNNPDDISLPNVLRQCLNLISEFPLLSVYGYQAYSHYVRGKSLYIHNPKKELSTAENILRMLRPDKKYTDLEAKILDLALILHMEHGGGNNSTFTTHVVSSSGTDTYSAIAAALGSLKGPKHGGANIKVIQMFQDMKPGGSVVLNGDDPLLSTIGPVKGSDPIFYGLDQDKNAVYATDVEPLGLKGTSCTIHLPEGSFSCVVPIPGIHMVSNALAGSAVGSKLGLTTEEIKRGIESLPSIPGRNHIIQTDRLILLDDCYNANPVSMKASLDVLNMGIGRKVAVLGDMGELGPDYAALHRSVGEYAAEIGIDLVCAIGPMSKEIAEGAASDGTKALWFETKADFLAQAKDILKDGDNVLIKASHGMEFPEIVEALR